MTVVADALGQEGFLMLRRESIIWMLKCLIVYKEIEFMVPTILLTHVLSNLGIATHGPIQFRLSDYSGITFGPDQYWYI